MLKNFLKPSHETDLIRFGNNWDGGYLIPKDVVYKTKYLISFGVGYDWSFEKDFNVANKDLKVLCFDHTVNKRFWYKYTIIAIFDFIRSFKQRKKIFRYFEYKKFFNNINRFHFQKKVVDVARNKSNQISIKNLSKIIKNNIFLKIDIENDEWRILGQIRYFKKLLGLVIELHNIDLHSKLLHSFLKKNKYLKIVHIHSNNMGGISCSKDPLVIELTLLNINLSKNYKAVKKNIPFKKHKFDFKNDKFRDEIKIKFKI
jgi:hypothetical protein